MTQRQYDALMQKGINPDKTFSIVYQKKDGTVNDYIVRGGVTQWKDETGAQETVKGTGYETPEGCIRLFCFNRHCYRMFIEANIVSMKQGDTYWHNPEILDMPLVQVNR